MLQIRGSKALPVLSLAALFLSALFLSGAFGGATDAQSSHVAITAGFQKGTAILEWPSAVNATGYALSRDGLQVSTAGPGATSAKFAVTSGRHTLASDALYAPVTSTTTATTTPTTTATVPTTTATVPTTTATVPTTTATVPTTTSTPPTGVAPPIPPSAYSVPSGTVVSTSVQFQSALAAGGNVILADGVYDNTGYWTVGSGSHIYAQHLLGATLRAGLVFGGNFGSGGGLVQGVAFDVSDPTKTFQGGIINTWGSAGDNTTLLDDTFNGNRVVGSAVFALNPQGMDVERLVIRNMHDNGLRLSNNSGVAYGTSTAHIKAVNDINIDWVSYPTPQGSNGTAEAGLFIGQPVDNGVHRIKVRNVAVSGIETVNNSWNTSYTDLDIDLTGDALPLCPTTINGQTVMVKCTFSATGIYLEHYNWYNTFSNFKMVGVHHGFNGEWDHYVVGNGGSHFTTIQDGSIDATGSYSGGQVGVYLDEGSDQTTVRRVTFLHQDTAGIVEYLNNKAGGSNTYQDNVFVLAPGVPQISTTH